MANVYFDIETKSNVDLAKVGLYNYVNATQAEILMIAYRVGINSKTELWLPRGSNAPDVFKNPSEHTFYAMNIQFDRTFINKHGGKYGCGFLDVSNCIDVMALTARYGFPKSLDYAGEVMVGVGKDTAGKTLIDKITQPPWQYSIEEFNRFVNYCISDVDLMCKIIEELPSDRLDSFEQQIWEDTVKINETGIPVDVISAQRIYSIVQRYIEEETEELPELTDYKIRTVNQTIAIKEWINEQGGDLIDLSKETVNDVLRRNPEWMTPEIKAVLALRSMLGKSSIAKYKKIIDQSYQGRMYNNFVYFGGHTGREAGRGFQMQNLPREKVSDPEKEIEKFFDMSILKFNPVRSAKALIRSMIKTSKTTTLGVRDYSAIEFRVILWLANETDALERIRNGEKTYRIFAAQLYKLMPDKVSSEQRNFGKTAVLGCGFGLTAAGLHKQCIAYGIDVTYDECEMAVNHYRTIYSNVTLMWKAYFDAVTFAISDPGNSYKCYKCNFKYVRDRNNYMWLVVTLPSDRNMYYFEPEVDIDGYWKEITYWGLKGTTKKWTQLDLHRGKLTENIVQAIARDILMDGRRRLLNNGHKVIASIHDENIIEMPLSSYQSDFDDMKRTMEQSPYWAKDLPLATTGYIERRYKKD